jgi:ectoine hydroxylase-related dioxygenase (phytanoyl-CoA dioxygenase family)
VYVYIDILIHFEENTESVDGKQLCRAENFANYHDGFNRLCRENVQRVASRLFQIDSGDVSEGAVLFKEKINFKHPGGGGFLAHQDSVAYIGLANRHISAMVVVDKSTVENGCLQFSPGNPL